MLAGDKVDLQTSSATVKGSVSRTTPVRPPVPNSIQGMTDHLRRVCRGAGIQRGQHDAVAGVHGLTSARRRMRGGHRPLG